MTALQTKLQTLRKELNAAHLERKSVIDGLLATLLANQNALLYGPPGTGKSLILREICFAIADANFFQRLLHKAMSPDEVLGQISLKALENDVMKRNTSGRLQEAHLAFLDEVFRGNGVLLNSLLELMNERTYDNPDKQQSPLRSIVGATNSIDSGSDLEAFADRFVYRPWLFDLKTPSSTKKLLGWTIKGNRPQVSQGLISLAELDQMCAEVQQVKISDAMVDAFTEIIHTLIRDGFVVSARRRVKLLQLVRCFAYVQGDDQVYLEHIHELLPQCCWKSKIEEIREIKRLIETAAPIAKKELSSITQAAQSEVLRLEQKLNNSSLGHTDHVNAADFARTQLTNLSQSMAKVKADLCRNGASQKTRAEADLQAKSQRVSELVEGLY
ncbi:AAA family ATPase [Acaryochloris marina]|uniref:AAA family ATPase n=1 Tax=Acaryochloris marina TaxID=155978 RepID=UPI001BAF6434|nr:AAA family ATPase [Acaryochloris marina]QUY46283.1 MoxR family ATPase [Acaryochloris marina S15]